MDSFIRAPWLAFLVGAIFFALQVPLSMLWFRRFAYGPMEYLWRVLSYGRRPQAPAAEPVTG